MKPFTINPFTHDDLNVTHNLVSHFGGGINLSLDVKITNTKVLLLVSNHGKCIYSGESTSKAVNVFNSQVKSPSNNKIEHFSKSDIDFKYPIADRTGGKNSKSIVVCYKNEKVSYLVKHRNKTSYHGCNLPLAIETFNKD